MPVYSYKCEDCEDTLNVSMSFAEYRDISNDILCKCGKASMRRAFRPFTSKVERNASELLEIMKDDIKNIEKKIKSGDINTIEDIYGK